jgi:sec-independent protein translocase protein TatC
MTRQPKNAEMPFLDHLEELRQRLFWVLGSVMVGVIISLSLHAKFDLVQFVIAPAKPYLETGKLQMLNPADNFTIVLTLCIWIGVILASPVILYHIWGFVSPALYPNEKRVGGYVLAGGLVLFAMGAALAFFYILPASLKFFQLFAGPSFTQAYTAREYFSLVITMVLTLGVAFELPIVILGLTALGLVTPTFLRKYRRHALVMCVIGAALMTPGDALTATVFMIIPLYFLYELGILLSHRVYKWRQRHENRLENPSPEQATQ